MSREIKMGGKGSGGWNKGKTHSYETRKKISIGNKGKKHIVYH